MGLLRHFTCQTNKYLINQRHKRGSSIMSEYIGFLYWVIFQLQPWELRCRDNMSHVGCILCNFTLHYFHYLSVLLDEDDGGKIVDSDPDPILDSRQS